MEKTYEKIARIRQKSRVARLRRIELAVGTSKRTPRAFNAAQMYMRGDPDAVIEDVCAYLKSIWPSEFGDAEFADAERGRNHFAKLQKNAGRAEKTSGKRAKGDDAREGDNTHERKKWEHRDTRAVYSFLLDGIRPPSVSQRAMARTCRGYFARGGCLYRKFQNGGPRKALQSEGEKTAALAAFHAEENGGHFGAQKTYRALTKIAKVYWPGMFADTCQ